jgi:hypothetical protein
VLVVGLSLYLVNCAALVFAFHPALLVTVLALAVFPRARPRTPSHPALAVIGLGGYLFALLA